MAWAITVMLAVITSIYAIIWLEKGAPKVPPWLHLLCLVLLTLTCLRLAALLAILGVE